MVDESFIRNRITELRLNKNVSEYQMSLDLGQSKGYIQGISSGRALPSMAQFLNICDYFEIDPTQFFDTDELYPPLVHEVLEGASALKDDDLMLVLALINRLKDKNNSNCDE